MGLMNGLSNLLGNGGVFLYEGAVHCHDAAYAVGKVGIKLGADALELAVLYHGIGKGVAEQCRGYFAVFHCGNAGVCGNLNQLNIAAIIYPVRVKQQGGDVIVGLADAVGDGYLLTLQVGRGGVFAVRKNVEGLAADVGAAYKGDVHAVGDGNQHLGHHAGGNVYLVGA